MTKPISKRKHLGNLWFVQVLVMLSLLVMSGCAYRQTVKMPAITRVPTGQYQVGKFVWFDLLSEDVKAAQDFYGKLFGWRYEGKPSDYVVIYSGGKPIGGMAPYESKDKEVLESFWLGYLSVDDIDRAVSAVKAGDGKVLEGPMNVEDRGRLAVIRDPEGAILVLIHASGGDPENKKVNVGEFLWVDLFSEDPAKANEFYGAIAGYTAQKEKTGNDHTFDLLKIKDHAYAGVVKIPWEDVEPNWLPYIKVEGLNETVAKAEKLGGGLILRLEHIAVIADPSGGVFGIQEIKGGKS